jgi:hypothetical protein
MKSKKILFLATLISVICFESQALEIAQQEHWISYENSAMSLRNADEGDGGIKNVEVIFDDRHFETIPNLSACARYINFFSYFEKTFSKEDYARFSKVFLIKWENANGDKLSKEFSFEEKEIMRLPNLEDRLLKFNFYFSQNKIEHYISGDPAIEEVEKKISESNKNRLCKNIKDSDLQVRYSQHSQDEGSDAAKNRNLILQEIYDKRAKLLSKNEPFTLEETIELKSMEEEISSLRFF